MHHSATNSLKSYAMPPNQEGGDNKMMSTDLCVPIIAKIDDKNPLRASSPDATARRKNTTRTTSQ